MRLTFEPEKTVKDLTMKVSPKNLNRCEVVINYHDGKMEKLMLSIKSADKILSEVKYYGKVEKD